MKQLFFVLLLVAIASSGYLKAIQSQDDAAREVAQVFNEEKKTPSQHSLGSSFEQVAKQVSFSAPVVSPVTTTLPAKKDEVVTFQDGSTSDDVREAESQIADLLVREPEIEKLFANLPGDPVYSIIKNELLMGKNPGIVRLESKMISNGRAYLDQHPHEALNALTAVLESLPPELKSEMGSSLESLKEMYSTTQRVEQNSQGEQP